MHNRTYAIITMLAALSLAPTSSHAQARASRPTITAVRAAAPPTIDGRLDDPIWQTAARITTLVQQSPLEGAPATEDTEVLIAYDSKTLYFGIRVHYSDPSLIRANRVDRDQTGNDDTVTISVDPFLDAQRGYAMSVNAYGVQADALLLGGAGGGRDTAWNALFQSAGMLADDGWIAEMAVPLKSLRYPGRGRGELHRWGLQIQRDIKGRDEVSTWAPLSTRVMGVLAQMGVLEGMRDLSTERNLEVLPTVTALQVGRLDSSGGFGRQDVKEAGVSLKYGVTSNLTLDLTANPDFSQIESDRPQIEVNQRFPLLFAELRPFFLEGQEVFRVNGPYPYLHTRTILDPRVGVKLSGKIGRTTLGLLAIDDQAPGKVLEPSDPVRGKAASVLVGRARYDLFRESYTGVLAIARSFQGTHSRIVVSDSNFRIGRSFLTALSMSFTDHKDRAGVTRKGSFVDLGLIKQGRHINWIAAFHDMTPDYRNDNGFVPRPDQRRAFGNVSYRWWPETWITNWGPRVNYERLYNHRGVLQDEVRTLTLDVLLARNISASAAVGRNLERFAGIPFTKTRTSFSVKVDASRLVAISADGSFGDEIRFVENPFVGRTSVLNAAVTLRPMSRLQSELRLNTTNFRDVRTGTTAFDVKILDVRTTYQLTPRLLVRNILAANTLNGTFGANLLVTYRVNAGTVFFAGYDDRYRHGDRINDSLFPTADYQRTNQAVFTKLQYLFRR